MASPSAQAHLAAPPVEQRSGERFRLLLRAGKLRTPDGEFLCVVRDVSESGVKVRVFHQVPRNERCELELGSGARLQLIRVWQNGDHAGFRFANGPIAVDRLIAEAGPFPKRHVRLRLQRPVAALVIVEKLALTAQLYDISQHGAALVLDQRLAIGRSVTIEALHLPALHARVRWRRKGLHGLVFQGGFRLDTLALIAAQLQLSQNLAPDPPKGRKSSPALTTD